MQRLHLKALSTLSRHQKLLQFLFESNLKRSAANGFRSIIVLCCFFICACFFVFAPPAFSAESLQYSEDRQVNFVFLLDVSGSMISPNTLVKSKEGNTVTLFEALREALKQTVADVRLIGPKSKIAFITFGTAITEKSNWPVSLSGQEERKKLLECISSTQELQADRHGDTYMAGGLAAAYKRAEEFAASSEPCASTFIIMLTDGWDEAPANAVYKIGDEALKFQSKQREIKKKLGVNTWQVRVVGLQRLPEKKAGSTTAAEVAKLLGGEFIDVSKSQKGTVAERIYGAVKQTIAGLKGRIDLPAADSMEAWIDFGRISEKPFARAFFNVWNRSCYPEKIDGVRDLCSKMRADEVSAYRRRLEEFTALGRFPELPDRGKTLLLSSDLPEGAIRFELLAPEILIAPVEREGERAGKPSAKVELSAIVGPSCPPGAYLGFLDFSSTAKVSGRLPYLISVLSRLAVDKDLLKVQVRKKGFISDEDSETEFSFCISARVNSSYKSEFEVIAEPSAALLQSQSGKNYANAQLADSLFNDGRAAVLKVVSGEKQGRAVRFSLKIPADTVPGLYKGKISVRCKEHCDLVADTALPYLIEVLPSPWDEMSPLAIPIFSILVLMIFVSACLAVIGNRDRI